MALGFVTVLAVVWGFNRLYMSGSRQKNEGPPARPIADGGSNENSASKQSSGLLTGHLLLGGREKELSFELFLFGPQTLERRERYRKVKSFTIEDLPAGPLSVQILPMTGEDEFAPYSGTIEIRAGQRSDLFAYLSTPHSVAGRVMSVSDQPCPFLYVQAMIVPIEQGRFRFAGNLTREINFPTDPRFIYQDLIGADPDRARILQVIRPDAIILGAATRLDGSFRIRGIAGPLVRIQVFNQRDLVYDGYLAVGEKDQKLVVAVPHELQPTSKEILCEHFARDVNEGLVSGLLRHVEAYPDSLNKIRAALRDATSASSDPAEKKQYECALDELTKWSMRRSEQPK